LSSAKVPPRWVTGFWGLLLTAKTLRTETGRGPPQARLLHRKLLAADHD